MRGKKKANNQQKQKAPQNKIKVIITSDGKQFKINDSVLIRYSGLLKNILEQEKDQAIKLTGIDGEAMQYIKRYFDEHKDKEPIKISLPIKSNRNIRDIMEQCDARIVDEVMSKGDKFYKKILDATNYLQVQQFKKRLIIGLVIRLTKKTVDELKEEYGLKDGMQFNEQDIRKQIRQKFQILKDAADQ